MHRMLARLAPSTLFPGLVRAQEMAEFALVAGTMTSAMAPRVAQDSPIALLSPGEHGMTRAWSATDMTGMSQSARACFPIPLLLPKPPSSGACGLTAQQLLAQPDRPAPTPSAATPADDFMGALNGLARTMRHGLPGAPTQAADLAGEAARAYSAGDYTTALSKSKEAVVASVARFGREHPETGVSLSLVGRACMALGQTEHTESLLNEALERTRFAGSAWRGATAAILDAKGQLDRQLGHYDEAKNLFEDALGIYRTEKGGERNAARTLNQLD